MTSSYSMNQRPSNRLPKLDPSTVGKDPGHEKEYLTTMSTTTSKLSMNRNSTSNINTEKFDKYPGFGIEYLLEKSKPLLSAVGGKTNYIKHHDKPLSIHRHLKPHTPRQHKPKIFGDIDDYYLDVHMLDDFKKSIKFRTNGDQGQYRNDGRSGRYWGFDRL